MLRTASNLALPQTLAEIVDPSRSALLVYDMQVGTTRQVKDAPRIVNVIREGFGLPIHVISLLREPGWAPLRRVRE
jgi:hypothetical protein